MTSRAPDYPRFTAWIARSILSLFGWQAEGVVPDYPKFVIIGAPHTSNWDGIVFVLATFALRTRMHWIGKHTLFRPPIGWLMRLGAGIPINRQTTQNAVEQVVQILNERERMVLAIAPEGTRKKTDHWKTGFYYIALGAKVPIILGYLDYGRKRVGVGPTIHPSGNIETDFVIIQTFFANIEGRHPEKKSAVVLPPSRN
jgi:1-acyl-sn-glycerol-3-phosphate acyltransferase